MIETNGLMEALRSEEIGDLPMDDNDDLDFGEVLKMCGSGRQITEGKVLKYADGTEKAFSFDN